MIPTLQDLDIDGRRVLVRVDFNVPVHDGVVGDDTRIRATLPTLRELVDGGATLFLMSHLGRPKGPQDDARMGPVAERLTELLGHEVRYLACDGPASDEQRAFIADAPGGSVTMLENTRFDPRETKNDPELARVLAGYAACYVNDAFGAAHRAHASTEGVARHLPGAVGRLMEREIDVLGRLITDPERPFKVILGGAKVSDKIGVIENLLTTVDELFVGGAMAYTFFAARGGRVGDSLVERDRLEQASALMQQASDAGVSLHLPSDSVCAREVAADAGAEVFPSDAIPDGFKGLDAGPSAVARWREALQGARTVFWNGPLGVFEVPPFDAATRAMAKNVAHLDAFTVVGGGDSVAALAATGLSDRIDHVSTGGGASLEFLEGTDLPGIAVLRR
ncbi:MAG: phosphoglycerate kinase [Trueperaceae bacterium]|nr:phosphoglycerate kinase [Trueperaceae bacterium]